MSITITITGDAAQVRAHMVALLGAVPLSNGELGAPKENLSPTTGPPVCSTSSRPRRRSICAT